ncbi:MAG: phage head-tail connector protein [Clostridia bacterium]|nr:phage head-tail connector protein [Clostridia bacterium]MBR6787344.1 phage head-tail connector protein [Clostridia bacterium]
MSVSDLLTRLKRRLSLEGDDHDELLCDLIADAHALMLAYMNRTELPEALIPALLRLSCMLYNRLGMEGESQRSEGSVSMTVDSLPQEIISQLTPYRLMRTVQL